MTSRKGASAASGNRPRSSRVARRGVATSRRVRSVATSSAPSAVPAGGTPARRLPIVVSNPQKVFWPDDGYTKLDLVEYYADLFPKLRPYVRDRLLSLKRCPNGMRGECFFQKEKPAGMPSDTPTRTIVHAKVTKHYVVGGRLETQLALVNLGCIAVHVWGSRAPTPRQPDWVCFDLDPDSGRFADAARAGLRVK